MATVTCEIVVCGDCLLLIANGELTDSDGNDIAEAHAAKITALWGDEKGSWHLVPACDENCDGEFSSSQCDGCGSTLGGDRHKAVVFD